MHRDGPLVLPADRFGVDESHPLLARGRRRSFADGGTTRAVIEPLGRATKFATVHRTGPSDVDSVTRIGGRPGPRLCLSRSKTGPRC
jgi:hypothetical protein